MHASFAPRLTSTPMLEAGPESQSFLHWAREIVNNRISDRPVSRRGLVLRSHSQSKLVGLMEHLVSILWAVSAAIAVSGSWAAVAPSLCLLVLRIRISRRDGASARCSASNQPDQPSASCPFTPLSKTLGNERSQTKCLTTPNMAVTSARS